MQRLRAADKWNALVYKEPGDEEDAEIDASLKLLSNKDVPSKTLLVF